MVMAMANSSFAGKKFVKGRKIIYISPQIRKLSATGGLEENVIGKGIIQL